MNRLARSMRLFSFASHETDANDGSRELKTPELPHQTADVTAT